MPRFYNVRRRAARRRRAPMRRTRRSTRRSTGIVNAVGPMASFKSRQRAITPFFHQGVSSHNCALLRNPLLPARKFFICPYTEHWAQYNCGVAGIMGTENVFRLSSIFDPDLTGVGHIPYQAGQFFAFYRKYIVTDVEILISVNNCTTAGAVVYGQVQSSSSTQTLTGFGIHTVDERRGIIGPLYPNLNGTGNVVSENAPIRLNIAAIEGMSQKQLFANEDFFGTSTSNPTLTSYLRVASGDISGLNNNPCFVRVKITYFGWFFDVIDQAMSS